MGPLPMNFYIDDTMAQAGIDQLAQSHASYEASALPPSHHAWISREIYFCWFFSQISHQIIVIP